MEYVKELRFRFFEQKIPASELIKYDKKLSLRKLWLILTAQRKYKAVPFDNPNHAYMASILGPKCRPVKEISNTQKRNIKHLFMQKTASGIDEYTAIDQLMHKYNLTKEYCEYIVGWRETPWRPPK